MKSKINFLAMLGVIFVAILLFNSNTVYGASGIIKEGTLNENSLDGIPNEIILDIKEIEYEGEKVSNLVFNKIVTEMGKKGIIIESGGDVSSSNSLSVYVYPYNIKEAQITLRLIQNDGNSKVKEKKIAVLYSNSSEYNEDDKSYVESLWKNINLPIGVWHTSTPGVSDNYGYEYEIRHYFDLENNEEKSIEDYVKESIEVLKEKINNPNISITYNMRMGGGPIFGGSMLSEVYIFYKDLLYSTKNIITVSSSQIIVPSNVEDTDTAFINYALPKVKAYIKSKGLDSESVSLEKESGYYYKVKTNDANSTGKIVIRKNDGIFVETDEHLNNSIYVNNLIEGLSIKVKSKENNSMIEDVKDKGYTNILGSYEFTLTGADKLSQPIDITFNVGNEYNEKIVYVLHQKQDGTYEEFERTVAEGKFTITVSELSPFVIGVKEEQVNNDEKDDTPRTGGTINTIYFLLPLTVVSLVGAVALKKKEQN